MTAKSVADLPGFPFATFAEFQQAHKQGRALVWVRYDFRIDLALRNFAGKICQIATVGSAFFISVALGLFAVRNQDYRLLLGIPATLVGFRFATPNPGCMNGFLPAAVTLAAWIASVFVDKSFFWVGLAAFVSWFATCAGQGVADMAVRAAMVQSEESFLWLYSHNVITAVAKGHASTTEQTA